MLSSDQIRAELSRYLAGEIPLHVFEDRLVDVFWSADPDQNPEIASIVGSIHIALAEYSRGDIPLSSMKEELANAIRPFGGSGHR